MLLLLPALLVVTVVLDLLVRRESRKAGSRGGLFDLRRAASSPTVLPCLLVVALAAGSIAVLAGLGGSWTVTVLWGAAALVAAMLAARIRRIRAAD